MIIDKDIALFEAAISEDACKEMIDFYERAFAENRIYTRRYEFAKTLDIDESETKDISLFKKDASCNLYLESNVAKEVILKLWECWEEVLEHYVAPPQDNAEVYSIEAIKIQKTSPKQGYHVWHTENHGGTSISRVSAFSVYLNDVYEGGETEFLTQSKRFSPRTGDVLIWPAHYTHPHRGNPPLETDKYIATGWFFQ